MIIQCRLTHKRGYLLYVHLQTLVSYMFTHKHGYLIYVHSQTWVSDILTNVGIWYRFTHNCGHSVYVHSSICFLYTRWRSQTNLCTTMRNSFPDVTISCFACSCSSSSEALLLICRTASPAWRPACSARLPGLTCNMTLVCDKLVHQTSLLDSLLNG